MASGKEHHNLWKKYRIPFLIISLLVGFADIQIAFGMLFGYLMGSVITPDMDLIGIDRGESLMIRSVIFLPMVAWSTMYARIMQVMGGHRSFWSHFPFISSFIRLCWFLFPFVLILYYLGYLEIAATHSLRAFLGTLVGLSAADMIHFRADQ